MWVYNLNMYIKDQIEEIIRKYVNENERFW
jgi:hypothetical protein